MKQKSSDSSDQLKNATPRRSLDHTSPNGCVNTLNVYYQPPHTSTSDVFVSEHQSVPAKAQSFSTYSDGTSEYHYNDMDHPSLTSTPNAAISEHQSVPSTTQSSPTYTDSESQLQVQQKESDNSEVATCSESSLAVQYSDEKAASLKVKLYSGDTFSYALQLLISWLKNMEFTKSNGALLFSLISTAKNNLWRLIDKKTKYKEELNNVTWDVYQNIDNLRFQFQQMRKVFKKVKLKKNWDQFSRPQRKMICTWEQKTKEIISDLSKEIAEENLDSGEDSSENSDSRESSENLGPGEDSSENSNLHKAAFIEEYWKCQEELDSLRFQLKATENNNVTLCNEIDSNAKFFEKTILDMNKQYDKMRDKLDELKILFQEDKSLDKNNKDNEVKSGTKKDFQLRQIGNSIEDEALKFSCSISEEEIKLVAAMGTFLSVHPSGAHVDYITSYLSMNIDSKFEDARFIENLLCRFPKIFREVSCGVGANITKKWVFLGFRLI